MSQDRAIDIPCASGEPVQTNVLIQRHGDLIQILGHPERLLTPKDALQAASALKRVAIAAMVDSMPPSETLNILAAAFERMNDAHD